LADISKQQLETKEDAELRQALDNVHWPVVFGCVTIQVREGKATMVKVERTIKLD